MLALLAAAPPPNPDPRVGSWTLVSAQSTLTPANKLTVTSTHDGAHVVMSGETHLDFTAKANGHDTAVPGNLAFDQVTLKRIEKKQSEVTEKKNGAVVATVRVKISADGKELTIATTRKGHGDQTTVWTRSGGAKAANDPLSGEWTEDPGKTHLRMGQALTIDQDANGAVRFAGEFNYTAHFDGKPYDVKNSRNDTVTLQMVDGHTVDEVYRRDDQVTAKAHWLVSGDGNQMTVTAAGTFETGQKLNETLVFKKK